MKNLAQNSAPEDLSLSVVNGVESVKAEKDALWGPFKELPNCSRFRIELNSYDELYEAFGIKKRLSPRMSWEPHTNKFMNDYFEGQLRRMKRASDEEYWKIATWLLRYSNVMLLMALRHVKPRWHREMPLRDVKRVLRQVRSIAQEDERTIEYHRVWIPKAKPGELRPLGCPTLEWRIYLHMINQLLVLRAMHKGYYPTCQHGFFPQRGTMTAWQFILNSVVDRPDIYEIDLRKFFDGVKIEAINRQLQKHGVTDNWLNRLYDLNRSPVIAAERFEGETPQQAADRRKWMNGGEYSHYLMMYAYDITQGVPQGAPTSPFLSCMALQPLITQTKSGPEFDPVNKHFVERDLVGYADDWIIFGEHMSIDYLYNNKSFEKDGISIHPDKSAWVKRNGEWLKPLKFLGLEYDGKKDVLKASTRSGASLVFDKHRLVEALNAREAALQKRQSFHIPDLKPVVETKPITSYEYQGTHSPDSPWNPDIYYRVLRKVETTIDIVVDDPTKSPNGPWSDFIKSSFFGFAQSRLYANSWNVKSFVQQFELTYIPSSWCGRNPLRQSLDVFNSTSFAYSDLARILMPPREYPRKQRKAVFDRGSMTNWNW